MLRLAISTIEWFAIEGWWCVFFFMYGTHESMDGEFFKCTRVVALFTFGVVQQPHDPRRCALDRKVFKTVLLGHRVFTGCSIDERFQPSERRKCCLSSLGDWCTPRVRDLHTCTCWCSSSHHGANKMNTSTVSRVWVQSAAVF